MEGAASDDEPVEDTRLGRGRARFFLRHLPYFLSPRRGLYPPVCHLVPQRLRQQRLVPREQLVLRSARHVTSTRTSLSTNIHLPYILDRTATHD